MTKDFSSFGLPEKLMQALTRMNFTTPTPIQLEAIPVALAGRDILGSAQTGTGKTGAFGIPLIAKLMEDPFATALVMTPTRELASQVLAALQQMIPVQDIKVALLIGGDAMPKQFRQLQNKPRLIVGTPGRINDHLERGSLKLNKTKFLVLDETDRMLDMGFGIQIDTILKHVPEQGRQTMLFSATLPAGIVKISSKYLNNPQRISVGSTTTPAANIKQEMVQTSEADKYNHLLTQVNNRTGSIIIFVKTKYGADRLADRLSRADHAADAIHGDLKQSRRERVIMDFRNKKQRILVATDVAARGLDIPHIEHVINYDLPQCPEDYIHRIGRTARAGAEGEAVNLLTPADNAKWRAIQRLMDPNASLPSHKEEGNSRGGRSSGGPRRSFGGGKPGADKPWQKKPFFKDNDRSSSTPRPERPKWDSAAPQQERAVSSERPAFDRNERNDRGSNASAGGAERKPWVKREGGDRGSSNAAGGERKPWVKREGGDRGSSNAAGGERKPWVKREGGDRGSSNAAGGERKPWVKREGGDRGSSNAAGGERKPWVKREGGDRGNSNAGGGERKVWGNKPRGEQGRDGAPRTEGRRFDSKPAGQDGAPKKHYGDRMKARPNKTAA